jgi:hypothetical protein
LTASETRALSVPSIGPGLVVPKRTSGSGVEFDSQNRMSVPSKPTSSGRITMPECVHFDPSTNWMIFDAGNVPCINTTSPVFIPAVAASKLSVSSPPADVVSSCVTNCPFVAPSTMPS